MILTREFNLTEMFISEKEDVLRKMAMLVFIRNEPEFKFQDTYLDKVIVPFVFGIGLGYKSKKEYVIDSLSKMLLEDIEEKSKSEFFKASDACVYKLLEIIKDPYITFHIGAKTYTMSWDDIPKVYRVFADFNYFEQSLSRVYEQLDEILK